MDIKKTSRKAWHFIWDEDSIWSWLANIVIAFFLIKFIVYPGLGFLLGTNFPIVAVVSGSMEHRGETFENWWTKECCHTKDCTAKTNAEQSTSGHRKGETQTQIYSKWGITKEQYAKFPFTSGFNKGDIMILTAPKNLRTGDILVFSVQNRPDPIIHRIVEINTANEQTNYNTQGDNNCGSTAEFEKNITQERLLGKAYLKIPLLGWLKILFVEILQMTKLM